MKLFLSTIMLFSFLTSFSQKTTSIERILEKTEDMNLPFYSKNIDYSKTVLLDENKVLISLLRNNINELYYNLQYYDNDIQKNVIKQKSYKFRSVAKYSSGNIKFFIYKKSGNYSSKIFLITLNNYSIVDTLLIGYTKGESEIVEYSESKIDNNFKITQLKYSWNPKYSDKKLEENPDFPKSLIEIYHYIINIKTGEITFEKKEEKYSKCYPEQFTYKNVDCELFYLDSL